MSRRFKWKDAVILFDNQQFQIGFERGRDLYFHGGGHKLNSSGVPLVKASELLRVVAIPDKNKSGHFHLDDETDIEAHLEQIIGILAGYMSALGCPETPGERHQWDALPEKNMYAKR